MMEPAWFGALTTAVATLFGLQVWEWRECKKERADCRKENHSLWRALWRHSPKTNGGPIPDDIGLVKSTLMGSDPEVEADS